MSVEGQADTPVTISLIIKKYKCKKNLILYTINCIKELLLLLMMIIFSGTFFSAKKRCCCGHY
jgi:hypothetical protein